MRSRLGEPFSQKNTTMPMWGLTFGVLQDPKLLVAKPGIKPLGVSARSLRRRLSEEGTLYNVVVDRAIASVAIRLLLDEQRSIQEVSHELSFSDASTFCRAFKRWTGATPKQFLATHAQGPRTIRLDSEQGPPS